MNETMTNTFYKYKYKSLVSIFIQSARFEKVIYSILITTKDISVYANYKRLSQYF